MEAIILAGGLGTRLQSRLHDLPKAMAPVGGRPFLQILLDRLIDAGCGRVILSVGHLRGAIIDCFGNAYRGTPLAYAVEEMPLGTGGALRRALKRVHEDAVLVLNGDTVLNADYAQLLRAHSDGGQPLTSAVTEVENVARYGGVVVERGRVAGFMEKDRTGSGWINGGTYVLDREFPWPAHLAERFSFETDLLATHVELIKPTAFLCSGYFLDIGVPEDLDRAQNELAGLDVPQRD